MKKNMNRLVAISIALVLCLALLAACGSNEPTTGGGDTPAQPVAPPSPSPSGPAPHQGDIEMEAAPEGASFATRINIIQDNNSITVINPFLPAGNVSPANWVYLMIYDTLLDAVGDDNQITANLATSWDTDDWQTFNFKLRDDVYFHNGDKLTAQDVVNTILQARAGPGSSAFDVWRLVDTWNVVSDYEIELTLVDVNVDFLFSMCRPASGIINQAAIDADPDRGYWIGSGAFYISQFETADFTLMIRNDNWWNTDNIPPTEEVFMQFVPEMGTRAMMLQAGDMQVSFGTSAEDIHMFEDDPDNWTVYGLAFNDPQGLNFNLDDRITGDINFRMAVLHALDKREIAIGAAGKWADAEFTDGTFWGLSTEFRNTSIPVIERDLDKAREYLAASVWNGETIEISCAIITNQRAAQVVQAQLEEIGIPSEINFMDMGPMNAYLAYGSNESQISVFFTTMTPSAGSFRAAAYPGGSMNRAGFNNDEVTALIDEAARTADDAARRDIYYRIQEIYVAEQPQTTLYWRVNGIVFHNTVGGMILRSDLQRIDLRQIFMTVD